jgi:hypothetical protein
MSESCSKKPAWNVTRPRFELWSCGLQTLDSKRPNKVWRYELGQEPEEATLVYEEPDESFYLGLGRTRSDDYLVLSGHSEITRYLLVLPADTPQGQPFSHSPLPFSSLLSLFLSLCVLCVCVCVGGRPYREVISPQHMF